LWWFIWFFPQITHHSLKGKKKHTVRKKLSLELKLKSIEKCNT
jgi:hypothetical protein